MSWKERWEGQGDGFFLPEPSEDVVQDLTSEIDRWTDTPYEAAPRGTFSVDVSLKGPSEPLL